MSEHYNMIYLTYLGISYTVNSFCESCEQLPQYFKKNDAHNFDKK